MARELHHVFLHYFPIFEAGGFRYDDHFPIGPLGVVVGWSFMANTSVIMCTFSPLRAPVTDSVLNVDFLFHEEYVFRTPPPVLL